MNRLISLLLLPVCLATVSEASARRVVILKIDGLNADLLYSNMRQTDPVTGKSRLPWFSHIFNQNGAIFENFYVRGLSLSAPSWSMLDTGHHSVIRGNVEYDRYTGHVYDYLNVFPFYLEYARRSSVDMPGVEVLDQAGIPLMIDAFSFPQVFQSFELFQRGVRWTSLTDTLKRRFSSSAIFSMLESAGTPSMAEALEQQTESELEQGLRQPSVLYLDFFTGDVDHEGHATSEPGALLHVLRRLDTLAGSIWTCIQDSPLADQTIFAVVSDHGMNNVPGVVSQTFSLSDLLNSLEGGAHHVLTNRYQLSDYKLRGLNPLVHRAFTPSTASFYLRGEASRYPTAWLDIDGNERTAVHLRNSDLNTIHILLLQLANRNLPNNVRKAAATYLCEVIDRHRASWTKTVTELDEELAALDKAIQERTKAVEKLPKKWNAEQHASGEYRVVWRLRDELEAWEHEHAEYKAYIASLRALLNLHPDAQHPFHGRISEYVPELTLGDNNSVYDLEHYVAGPAGAGLALDANGQIDEERSFRHVNYFRLLAEQHVRNNPQPALTNRPIDFTAMRLPDGDYDPSHSTPQHAYWLYGDEDKQIVILADDAGNLMVKPVECLTGGKDGKIQWARATWRPSLPLHLFEDSELHLPVGAERSSWLSSWHTEREWLEAIHLCRYSNGVIGIAEELSPVGEDVPGRLGADPMLVRYERRRRELVQADFHVFAADHWNFNVRFPNPGGNHGSFLRISTHSVWMLAGASVPAKVVQEPYDSLNFASTIMGLVGKTPPIPDRVVPLE